MIIKNFLSRVLSRNVLAKSDLTAGEYPVSKNPQYFTYSNDIILGTSFTIKGLK